MVTVWITEADVREFSSEEQIRTVKGIGSRLWSHLWINVPGEPSASTGGAVDILPTAAVSLTQRDSLQPSCTTTTTNYWSVTQLGEWFMAFQKAVEGFNYKQLLVSNDCSPHICSRACIEANLSLSDVRISLLIATLRVVLILPASGSELPSVKRVLSRSPHKAHPNGCRPQWTIHWTFLAKRLKKELIQKSLVYFYPRGGFGLNNLW